MTRLHFDIHPGEGPPLLMIHGFLSSRAQWRHNLEALGEVCTPVTLELYGHGRSPAPTEPEAYSPAGYLSEFELIRKSLGAEKWLLCGYSLGAALTIRYAFEYPENTIAHIFTNSTTAFSPRPDDWDEAELINRFETGGIDAIENIPVHPRFAKKLPEDIKAELLRDTKLLNPGGIGRGIAYTNGVASVRKELHRNTRPGLLICGKEEKRFQVYRSFVEENMPETSIVDLEAGHAVNAERSDDFNQAATDFIKQHV